MTPVNVNKGQGLITLQLELNNASSDIQFSLAADPLNEIANGNFEVIDASLVIDIPSTSATGINNVMAETIEFSNQPNPFKGTTTLNYTIPTNGQVIIEVYDLVGSKVKELVEETQSAGTYSVKFDANSLQPGVYTAILKLKNADNVSSSVIKMINR
jgi:serine protease AprX